VRKAFVSMLLLMGTAAAHAQTPPAATPPQHSEPAAATAAAAPPEPDAHGLWLINLSLLNMFDGNINHAPSAVRSYGFVPAASFGYESSADPRFTAGYDIAANQYTGTDEWDRISHGVHADVNARAGKRWRFEAGGQATWKGSSEDRELSNEFGVSTRAAYRLLKGTRVIVLATARYKQYPDDPDTSGPAPYVGGKLDQRLPGNRRLVFGYKYEERRSQVERNKYRRNGYSVEFSTPFIARDSRLTIGAVIKGQTYRRLIKVGSVRELRHDRRSSVDAGYELPLSPRVLAQWQVGFEKRSSNDPDKRFIAPSFGLNLGYRWR
jgi:hypothetical protein